MVINSIDRWIDFENGSIVHLCGSLKFLHPSRKKSIDSPMVLASLRLTFPLSTFGIRYWPINLAGCLERGKWKEVFVSVKEMAWIFYFSFINCYEWFHFCIPSTQYYLILSYCSKVWNYDEILRLANFASSADFYDL